MPPKKNVPTDIFKWIDMRGGNNEECWPWKGKLNKKDGRPYFTIEGKRRPSYVIVLELSSGKAQKKGQMALHNCDNPICCNPSHLNWGYHQDNMDEMKERDRHGLPKIVVRAINNLLNEGVTHLSIAKLYGVSRETITAINNGRSHKGIECNTQDSS
jgi:hypothetical protein